MLLSILNCLSKYSTVNYSGGCYRRSKPYTHLNKLPKRYFHLHICVAPNPEPYKTTTTKITRFQPDCVIELFAYMLHHCLFYLLDKKKMKENETESRVVYYSFHTIDISASWISLSYHAIRKRARDIHGLIEAFYSISHSRLLHLILSVCRCGCCCWCWCCRRFCLSQQLSFNSFLLLSAHTHTRTRRRHILYCVVHIPVESTNRANDMP